MGVETGKRAQVIRGVLMGRSQGVWGSLPLGDSPEVAHKPLGDWGLREEPGPQRCPSRPAAQSPCVLQWSAGPLSTTSHTWLCQGQNS